MSVINVVEKMPIKMLSKNAIKKILLQRKFLYDVLWKKFF